MVQECNGRLLLTVQSLIAPKEIVVRDAKFVRTKELSVRWRLSNNALTLYVSDYLEDAPDGVLSDFCSTVLTHVFGGKRDFGKDFTDYTAFDDFLLRKRPIYLRRSKNLLRNDVGRVYALPDSVQRLYKSGLLDGSDIANTVFTWTVRPNYVRLGYCSQLMRVVAISSALDSDEFPEHALDYVVYHECMHLRQGYRPFNHHPHDAQFRRGMARFPDAGRAKEEIERLQLRMRSKGTCPEERRIRGPLFPGCLISLAPASSEVLGRPFLPAHCM